MSPREHVLSIRLNDPEVQRLDQLAQVYNLDRSTVVRQLIDTAPMWSLRWAEHAATQRKTKQCSCCEVHGPAAEMGSSDA